MDKVNKRLILQLVFCLFLGLKLGYVLGGVSCKGTLAVLDYIVEK